MYQIRNSLKQRHTEESKYLCTEWKNTWLQRTVDSDWLPELAFHYKCKGYRDTGRPLKRLLWSWNRFEPHPWRTEEEELHSLKVTGE